MTIPPKLRQLARYAADRMREPSTMAGFAAVASMAHHSLSNETLAGLAAVFGGVGAILAILLSEGG